MENDEMFNFATAMCYAVAGKKVQRQEWTKKGIYVFAVSGDKILPDHKYRVANEFCMKTAVNTIQVGWVPTPMDKIATDWIVTQIDDEPLHEGKDSKRKFNFGKAIEYLKSGLFVSHLSWVNDDIINSSHQPYIYLKDSKIYSSGYDVCGNPLVWAPSTQLVLSDDWILIPKK